MNYFVSLLLLVSFLASSFVGMGQKNGSKPNIIFILADDLGIGDLGVYGQKKINTPHLDQLAKEGMVFNQFYSGTSVCAPSRSTLMTGQHTGHTPIRGNKATKPEGQWPLPANTITIAEVLKKGGYKTGAFGKWGLGFVESVGSPNEQGFDEFFGYNCQTLAHNYYPEHLWKNKEKIQLPNTLTNQEVYAAELIQEQAKAFINHNAQEPFFLFLAYTLPHAALQVPARDSLFSYYKIKYQEQPITIANWTGKGYQPNAYPHAAYATMVSTLDAYVGEVRNALERAGIANNTIIFFASDNGVHREGGNDPDFFNSNGGFRGYKRDLYEGGIRTPFIVHWPNNVKAGSYSNHIGAFWDVLPTCAELAGLKVPSQIDGISFAPTLLGQKQKKHQNLYWEFHEQGGKQAVRMGKWKGVRLNAMEQNDAPIELYNLEVDPAEKNNLAKVYPAIVSKISKIMKQQHSENSDFPFTASLKK